MSNWNFFVTNMPPTAQIIYLITLPEVQALAAVPAGPPAFHTEGSALEHTRMVVERAARLSHADPRVMLAAAMHDVGKILTPEEILPKHHNHDERGVAIAEAVCSRLEVPDEIKAFVLVTVKRHHYMHEYERLTDKSWRKLFRELGSEEALLDYITVCRSDTEGRNEGTPVETYFAGAKALEKFGELMIV